MKTNKEVIQVAKRYIGQGGTKFRNYCGLPKGAAWCNAFVDYVANESGVKSLYFDGKKETYCPHSIQWCKKNLVQLPPLMAMAADIIYFDWEKNGVPNHIGFVLEKVNTSTIRTIEGNTNGSVVAKKNRSTKYVQGIYRPLFVPSKIHIGVIAVDGAFYYNSIANMQRALSLTPTGVFDKKTLNALQRKAGCKFIDLVFGKETAMCVQTMLKKAKCYSGKIDSVFGEKSIEGLQKWVNKMNAHAEEPAPAAPIEKTKAEKIIDRINEYAYEYGTPSSKYKYKGGSPKKAYKSALKKYMKKDAKISQSDCGYFVSTVIRSAGISKTFLALRGRKESFPAVPSTLKIVHKGKAIPSGLLKAGDIIRYKKKGGGQHTLFYYGNGKIAEAGRGHWFPAIKKDTKKYNKANVKKSSIQVLRGK